MIARLGAALLLVAFATGARAAERAPKPSPDAKRWAELLIGRATAKDARFVQDGKEYRGKVKFDCARVAAGWGTSCKATYSLEGHAPMDEAYLLGWDPVKGQAHWFEVTSTGVVHDHAGAWTDDGTITVTHRGLNASGEEEVDAITLKKQPGSRLLLSADGKVGTRTLWSFRATLVYQATK